jgi:hypothetical protein
MNKKATLLTFSLRQSPWGARLGRILVTNKHPLLPSKKYLKAMHEEA